MVLLLSLRSHFEQMEKSVLRDVYARTFALKGLVNNTLLLKELLKFYENEKRLPELFNSWDSLQKRVFSLIARSGDRGLRFRELRLAVPVGQITSLKNFLNYLCENFIVWKTASDQENIVYRAFVETYDFAMQERNYLEESKGQILSYGSLFDFHLCRILSFLKQGKLRVNAGGDLQRRSIQLCEQSITHSLQLSSKAPTDEVMLITQFLIDSKWVLKTEDSQLLLSPDAIAFLNKNGFRLRQEIFRWWVKIRVGENKNFLLSLLKLIEKPVAISNVVEYFWPLDPSVRLLSKKSTLQFDQLPRPLRELWLLGIVDFSVNRNYEIESVVYNVLGFERSEKTLTSRNAGISTMPNFEFVVPADSSPRVLFYASCLAIPENDESILRFRLDKDYFLESLRAGFSEQEVKQFMSWLNPPSNVNCALEEWAAVFFGASIFTARILKIDDKSIYDDLSGFPQFMELIQASIPGYGFLIRPECESSIRDLLIHYGLNPAFDNDFSSLAVLDFFSWSKNFAESWPQEQTADYHLEAKPKESSSVEKAKKIYGEEFQKLDISGTVKVLRYAKTSGMLFAVRIADPARKVMKAQEKIYEVRGLRLSQMPFVAKVVEKGNTEEENLDLSFIREIKLLYEGNS